MLVDTGRRSVIRFVWTLVLGLFLGGLLTKLVELILPDGTATRDFLLTSVDASVGPLAVDLVAVAFELGPVTLTLNSLTLVGIAIVAMIVRAWI
ncbi:MAG: hypothetical protein O2958_05915 [Gemmatimonadetes bacterium]|nr:hypothetical protein [Gemmatimonadota bacterium]MDA1104617.1 hypothetical protein [Gemmatimonadota bacterium]